jgi:hypothetical protein
MGYECPVCTTPQADAGHLANHLAITAIARGGDHEAWLDDHVDGWGDLDEDALAERVVEHAADTEFPQVFEDTTGDTSAASRPRGVGDEAALADLRAASDDDIDVDAIVERARELTDERRDDSETE